MIVRRMADRQHHHRASNRPGFSGQHEGVRNREKPVLDEKRLAEFVRVIGVSMFTEKPVKIKLFRNEEDVELIGLIDKVATDSRQLKIGFEHTYEWITLDDVIEMKIVL
ncbi:hypothetical protein DUZ99_15080 [Xylanibacillus composti]|uniref:YolD-like family protein n=1 Tax=Xylanibacillus composti TaxID=1572762 RepID=A0A8J4H6P8_9BACL|nr:YolD-like family protein [Xylanibacillus composti]MDT9726304.1 hypothetical protein [Xylanibacillus composti]GIQ70666.1 hypothetical protein XYCOK13_34900 [Xylanibacillus composti]